jgi:hypothetical protein
MGAGAATAGPAGELRELLPGTPHEPSACKNVNKQSGKVARDLDEVAAVADGKPATRPTALGVHRLNEQ